MNYYDTGYAMVYFLKLYLELSQAIADIHNVYSCDLRS